MEWAGKALSVIVRGSSNNTLVINTFLVGAFFALSIRSVNQQREIEALEAEKNTLLNTNKSLKKSMWDWKQQLFAEASSNDNDAAAAASSPLSLSKLKSIYGEASITQQGVAAVDAKNEDSKTSASTFMV